MGVWVRRGDVQGLIVVTTESTESGAPWQAGLRDPLVHTAVSLSLAVSTFSVGKLQRQKCPVESH